MSLTEIVQADAEGLAVLLRARRGERADRLAGRQLLMRVFGALAPAGTTGDVDDSVVPTAEESVAQESVAQESLAEEPDPAALANLATLAEEMRALRVRLAGPGWRVLAPIGKVWVRSPYPVFFMRPACAVAAQSLADRREKLLFMKLALSDERIDWMARRCTADQPGLLRPVRTPEAGQGSRLGTSELELLYKRGRSKFS